jgi:hypothetical protein
MEFWRTLTAEDLLTVHSKLDSALDLIFRQIWLRGADECVCIVSRLEKPVDSPGFVGKDAICSDLQSHQRDEEGVTVGFPPALLAGRSGELDQLIAAPGVDPVELEHVANVSGAGADLTVLDPRHLGVAAFEDVGDLVDGLAGGFTEAAEFDAEAAALDRGTWAGWHGDPPRAVGWSAWSQ